MESDNQMNPKDGGREGLFLSPEPDEEIRIRTYQSSFSQKASETTADAESDDDIMSIDEIEASRDAQRIWSLEDPFESRNAAEDLKVEPASQITATPVSEHRLTLPVPGIMGDPPQTLVPAGTRMLSAQQAMARQMLQKRKSNTASIFGGNPAKFQKSGPDFAPSAALNGNAEMMNGDSPGDSEELPSDENEVDDSWMIEGQGESQADELNSLKAARDVLKCKRDAGSDFLPNDAFKLLKIEGQIRVIKRRQGKKMPIQDNESIDGGRDADSERESETEDFSEKDGPQDDLLFSNDTEVEMAESEDTGSLEKDKAKKGRKEKLNRNARDVQNSRRHKDLQKLQKKKAMTSAANKKDRKKATAKQSPKLGENALKGSDSNATVDSMMTQMLMSLATNDQIAERIAHGDVGKAESILAKNKMKQLEQLLQGIPDDYDTHQAKADRKKLLEASKRFGHGKVKARNGHWLLTGMKSALLHHQLLAANWMVDRELASSRPYGGLLGDAMGLGKTIEMLACMVGNTPSVQDIANGRKATLIVLPSGVVKQWVTEIKKHVDPQIFEKILQYKSSMEISMVVLQDCDIVITSYQEVMKSLPFPTTSDDKKDAKEMGLEDWIKQHESDRGHLHRIKWYRIVLDEAHAIKNYRSRTSLACVHLDGKFRWAMTGTPLMNSLDELYPYFKFLRVPYSADINVFRRRFGDPDTVDSNRRLAVILAIIMLRRTMRDKILGRPIVDLPLPHPSTKIVNMSDAEKTIYRLLEQKFRDIINQHFERGDSRKNYGVFLAQLLRLRQATAHPFLLEQCVKDLFDAQDLAILKAKLEVLGGNQTPIYEQLQLWVGPTTDEATEEPVNKAEFGRSEFGKHFEMGPFLASMNENALFTKVVCRLCGDLPDPAVITDCKHIFCRDCLESETHRQAAATESDYTECPTCQKAFSGAKPYNRLKLKRADDDMGFSTQGSHRGSANARRADEKPTPKDAWFKLCINENAALLPSAKMIALKSQILKWLNEAPDDKILIFTQFRMMAKIIGLICDQENWGRITFTGDMNVNQRNAAIVAFHQDPKIKIMIAGLKCGGQSLNLTCANRCVNIDLWWNHSVEQQAFGRIFRIGQEKETYFTRLVCRNTVDERMLKMQASKMALLCQALQDNGEHVKPLDVEELARLFGDVVEVNGVKKVVADYDDEDDE